MTRRRLARHADLVADLRLAQVPPPGLARVVVADSEVEDDGRGARPWADAPARATTLRFLRRSWRSCPGTPGRSPRWPCRRWLACRRPREPSPGGSNAGNSAGKTMSRRSNARSDAGETPFRRSDAAINTAATPSQRSAAEIGVQAPRSGGSVAGSGSEVPVLREVGAPGGAVGGCRSPEPGPPRVCSFSHSGSPVVSARPRRRRILTAVKRPRHQRPNEPPAAQPAT